MRHRNKALSRTKITIKELANHFKVHRNTASKWCKGVDRSDFFACCDLINRLKAPAKPSEN